MKPIKNFHSPGSPPEVPPKSPRSPANKAGAKRISKPCALLRPVKTKSLTTAELAVACVEVVEASGGRPFLGPFFTDELEDLRQALRGLARRDKYEVAPDGEGFSIYRKPTEAKP